uniref:N-alpha-acetyltransferase 40 n=1 Tax=Lynceus sp. MCZ IZ 141354 TaxID=1930659 RepID=A0A9N6WV47_9CRUS|nr:EOG090X0MNC [Lynceus sp. MCZ IZ 141354]
MQAMYEASQWGWNWESKQKELFSTQAAYLIGYRVTESQNIPVAFSHFRFDLDYERPVVYCYELQLEKECRRQGIGRFMLNTLESMAVNADIPLVVLTVFKHNEDAIAFFHSCGYLLDETNPDDKDYTILSKQMKTKSSNRES